MEIQRLIRRMKSVSPSWGAPRIHGELLQLGFEVSEPTVSRYLQRLKGQPDKSKVQRWLAFLQNHRELIAAFDFFTAPTLHFRVLYCSRHRASSAPQSPLQRHRASDERLDFAAAPRGPAASMPIPLHHLRS